MIFGEWNWDDALAVAREEAKEESREETLEEVFSLLRQGYSVDEAEEILVKQQT